MSDQISTSGLHVTAADLAPLGGQKASHPRAGEFQIQPVEAPHDRQVGVRHRRGRYDFAPNFHPVAARVWQLLPSYMVAATG
jgi:hypothetical protein